MIGRAAILLALLSVPAAAHDVITTKLTWSRDISRVFAHRCVSCHGAEAAVPLTTYPQVRPWAVDIKEQVLSRAMPPWGAVKGFGDLSLDLALSQQEMLMISAWVIGGAPEGNPALGPKTISASPLPRSVSADALKIDTRARIRSRLTIDGLRPLTSTRVDSAKITATLSDGSVLPLLWLRGYDPAFGITFRFARPLTLPAGTVVASTQPLTFALTTISPGR